MIAAQTLNESKEIPIYGCYVLGRFWFFASLVQDRYCITNAYNATKKEDLLFIFRMLKAQKTMISERLAGKS